MKKVLFMIAICSTFTANAQSLLISFTGTGASATVTTVKVENLTKGTSLSLNGTDVLRLTLSTGISPVKDNQSSELKIYPNPVTENSLIEIYPPVSGDAVIFISDINGRVIYQMNTRLEKLRQEFRLSGLKHGIYVITVNGNGYQISGKLLGTGKSNGTIRIENVSNSMQSTDDKKSEGESKGVLATVDMPYSNGDWLKFTGISGVFSTIVTDKPLSDKTITFDFTSCVDGDGNNYPVVQIGAQIWMAENLKTTKFNDGSSIPIETNNTAWFNLTTFAYCWYENDISKRDQYGALYNWHTVNRGNLCPAGWHIPDDDEWTVLTTFLGGESVAGGKLKETGTAHWSPNTDASNETGFTALPGGMRGNGGYFFDLGYYGGYWWSATENWGRIIFCRSRDISSLYDASTTGCSVRCVKGEPEPAALPTVTTTAPANVTTTIANSGGVAKCNVGASITSRGICWSTSANPTTADSKTNDGTGAGSFTSQIDGLSSNTTYYIRAYAVNSAGTAYGDQLILKTMTGTVTDIDGNIYQTVTIDNRIWMAQNLKTTHYQNGNGIPDVADDNTWYNLSTGARCTNPYINNYSGIYGLLYNWFAVSDNRNVCPAGWHVPSDDEWTALITYLGGGSSAGGKLKEAGSSHWMFPNTDATNESGFTALPDGARGPYGFSSALDWGFLWSASENDATTAWHIILFTYDATVNKPPNSKTNGFSVRCIKDL